MNGRITTTSVSTRRPARPARITGVLACAVLVWMGCHAAAAADDEAHNELRLTIASSHTTGLPWVGVMNTLVVPQTNRRLEQLDSPYRVRWTESYGGSLYRYSNTLAAVEIGLTDMGWVGTLWELSKMPLQNVTYYAPFVTDDHHLLFEIFNELHETMPELRNAWTAQNQRFLGGSVVDTYHLMTNFPVRSVEDLRGRKILAPGPTAAWLDGTGAVAVHGALTTYYTQIQTGVADGVLTILTGAAPYRIQEVAPYITLVGLGAQLTGGMAVNLDTWQRLPPDLQDILTELGAEYSQSVADQVSARYDTALASMVEAGAVVHEMSEEERQRWLQAMPNIAAQWADATERRGFPAWAVLGAFMEAVRVRGGEPLRDWDRRP